MSYMMLPHVQLLLVKVPRPGNGDRIDYHYQVPGAALGPFIPWLSEQQREQFLREGLVVEVNDDGSPITNDVDAPEPGSDDAASDAEGDLAANGKTEAAAFALHECVAKLRLLEVPIEAGAVACRKALRESNFHFSNDTIAEAIRRRKRQPAAVPDSAESSTA